MDVQALAQKGNQPIVIIPTPPFYPTTTRYALCDSIRVQNTLLNRGYSFQECDFSSCSNPFVETVTFGHWWKDPDFVVTSIRKTR